MPNGTNLICFTLALLSLIGAVICLLLSTKSPTTRRYTAVSMTLSSTTIGAALIAYINQF